ncbi:DUF4279 domain-containing protein [uncultured Amnibacterium sp.]|uniref:DUF4279 domain-containing protein n=1 Tax=uncultured Amnibacterium sp. TaxID=1631851 RepID=UPI0035CAC63A
MIIDNTATLAVHCRDESAAAVSAILGIEPTRMWEQGDLFRNIRTGLPNAEGRRRQAGAWLYRVEFAGGPDREDQTGCGALTELLRVFADRVEDIRSLQDRYDVIVRWSGDSDSWQGGFVFPARVLTGLAALGCALHGDAYLTGTEEDDED